MLLLALALCLAPQRLAAQQPRPGGRASLVVACPDNAAPYSYRDADGEPAGLLPDFWRLFAERTELAVELRLAPAAEALAMVERGEADAHAGLTLAASGPDPPDTAAAGLEGRFAWTRPLLDQGLGLFALAEAAAELAADGAPRLEDAALDVGLLRGDAASGYIAAAFPNMRRREFPDIDALAAALALGQVRLAAAPVMAFRHKLAALGRAERFTLLRRMPGEVLRAAVRRDDQLLLARLNAGLDAIGPKDLLSLETRGASRLWPPPAWTLPAALCAALLAASLLALSRARRLRREAGARAHEVDLLRDGLLAEMTRHRKTQDLLSLAIEQSPSGIAVAYADGLTPPVINSQGLDILRLPGVPDMAGLRNGAPWRTYTAAGRHVPAAEMPLFLALDRGEVVEGAEYRIVFPDGEERWLWASAAPVRDAQGVVRAGVSVFQDVTALRQTEREMARFKFFLDVGVEEVYLARPSGSLAYVNEAVARSLGYATQEIMDLPLTEIDPAFNPDRIYRLLQEVRLGPSTFDTLQVTRDGRRVLKEIKAFYMRFGDEEYICAFGRDITEKRRLERELESTRALFAASLEQAPWGILVGDAATGRVSIANRAAADMLGVRPEELVGMRVNGHLPMWRFLDGQGEVVTPGETPLSQAIMRGESTQDLEVRFRLNDGPERWLLVNASPVRGPGGALIAAILVMADITARKQMEGQLLFRAMHDALTGLPNRARCLELLQEALDRARSGHAALAVAFVDLDRFKMLNDSLGHSFGDLVLLEAAGRLAGALGAMGRVCRFGGDEFVLLVDRARSADEAQELLRQALESLRRPMRVEGQELRLTASTGVVLDPQEEGQDAASVLQNADIAMHRAKDSGRDSTRLFHPGMLLRAQELLALDADLRRALEHGEIIVHYQPIMSLDGRRVLGVEALARWVSPSRGLVGPCSFIPHAEESGLIVQLGEQVLRQACREMAALRREHPTARGAFLAVNLSARQFAQPGLVEAVGQVLREAGLPPALLKLELTESALMADPEAALSAMRRLKSLGLSLAIDDFGTGYSSLSYLQRFPVDVLKIDRSFVRDLPREDADSRALVGAIAALAGSLGLSVVAEGVETCEQLEILRGMGCHAVQGFLFHRPMSGGELAALMEAEACLEAAAQV